MTISVGTYVAYQGRCWLVTKVMASWLHIVVPSNHAKGMNIPRTEVSTDMHIWQGNNATISCK